MGRLFTCLFVLGAMSAPALAKSGDAPRTDDGGARAIRLAAAYGVVTSTYRSPAHNRSVGGVANSYHLQARAMDVARRPGVTHRQIDMALRAAGYNLIESLDEGDHSHFAFGPVGPVALKAAAAPAPVRDEPPPEPVKPRLAADEHGTLLVDLASGPPTDRATTAGAD